MRFETRREKEIRRKRQKRSSIIALICAFGVVIMLSIVLWIGKQSLANKNEDYIQRKAQLEQSIEEEKNRTKELEEYQKYIQTKKFVEDMAKNKFGLIYPDEILLKPEK